MVIQVNVAEAKARLSELLDAAAAGRDVVLARAGRPIARLVAIGDPPPRTLGFLDLDIDDDLFAPLDDAEIDAWQRG
jgi:prevent-host-death family protein